METKLACLTAPGKAAIATLAVRGPNAWAITRTLFVPRKGELPADPVVGQYWFGKLGKDYVDEVIVAVKQGSPQTIVELHCHGGVEVVRMIQELYVDQGVRVAAWPDPGDGASCLMDLLAHAPTARTAAILLDQVNGAWEACQRAMQAAESSQRGQIRARLVELISLGEHLIKPWQVVIAGAPNVGKSSLMNALAGFTRSIVAPTAGTTRDAVTAGLAIDGWPVEIIDTAGIRESTSELERQGMARATDAFASAHLRFWLLDGSTTPSFPEDRLRWHFLINKIDLPAAWDWQEAPGALRISARTHAGLDEFCEALSRELVPQPPEPGEAVPVTAAQRAWVRLAL